MTNFNKGPYALIGGSAPLEDDGSFLHVRVYLSNDSGDLIAVNSYGRTTDEAIQEAIDFAERNTRIGHPGGWAMDEWEAR